MDREVRGCIDAALKSVERYVDVLYRKRSSIKWRREDNSSNHFVFT